MNNIDKTFTIGIYFIVIGAALWITSYLYLALWGIISEYTGMIFRVKYLESVLKQDISWFEDNDPQSLASKISKESTAIQAATGEKIANIIMGLSMSICGFVLAFYVGYEFTLFTLSVIPFLFLIIVFLIYILQVGYKKGEAAFKASSTLAEQALNSIKVVVAFGQEEKEETRFKRHLESARKVSTRFHFIKATGYALNNGGFLLIFAYALYFGGLFVSKHVHNDIQGRNYRGADTVAIFFGVMMGTWALGIAAPNFESVTKGRQAAHVALGVINRQPDIIIDDPNAEPITELQGEVEFKDVQFTYKT